MLQLIPYGWVIHPHWNPASSWLIRGKQFKQVARAVGASYRWVDSGFTGFRVWVSPNPY